jgi:hypothetical protein
MMIDFSFCHFLFFVFWGLGLGALIIGLIGLMIFICLLDE